MGVRKFPSCKIKFIAKSEAELVLPSVEDPSELLAEISVARKFPVFSPEISELNLEISELAAAQRSEFGEGYKYPAT